MFNFTPNYRKVNHKPWNLPRKVYNKRYLLKMKKAITSKYFREISQKKPRKVLNLLSNAGSIFTEAPTPDPNNNLLSKSSNGNTKPAVTSQ